eukprot:jgi/Mesvir1/2125/Mv16652-RA.1
MLGITPLPQRSLPTCQFACERVIGQFGSGVLKWPSLERPVLRSLPGGPFAKASPNFPARIHHWGGKDGGLLPASSASPARVANAESTTSRSGREVLASAAPTPMPSWGSDAATRDELASRQRPSNAGERQHDVGGSDPSDSTAENPELSTPHAHDKRSRTLEGTVQEARRLLQEYEALLSASSESNSSTAHQPRKHPHRRKPRAGDFQGTQVKRPGTSPARGASDRDNIAAIGRRLTALLLSIPSAQAGAARDAGAGGRAAVSIIEAIVSSEQRLMPTAGGATDASTGLRDGATDTRRKTPLAGKTLRQPPPHSSPSHTPSPYRFCPLLHASHIGAACSVCMQTGGFSAAEHILNLAHEHAWRQLAASVASRRQHTGDAALCAPTVRVYTVMAQGYCKAGLRDAALDLLQRMEAQGVAPDNILFNALLQGETQVDRMESLLGKMAAANIPMDERTYSAVMHCHGANKDRAAVERTWAAMRRAGVAPSTFTANARLNAHARCGEVATARRLVKKMPSDGTAVSLDTFNTLMKAHARAGDVRGVFVVLNRIRQAGLRPDHFSFNTAMDGCLHGGAPTKVPALRKAMEKEGLKPDAVTYAILLRHAGTTRESRFVDRVLREMEADGCKPDRVVYRSAILAYIRCADGGAALQMTEDMAAAGYKPQMRVTQVLLQTAESALVKECKMAAVQGRLDAFLEDIRSSGMALTPATCDAIIRDLSRDYGIPSALATFRVWRSCFSPAQTNRLLRWLVKEARAVSESNPAQGARAFVLLLPLLASATVKMQREDFSAGINACISCGDGPGALALYEAMLAAGIDPPPSLQLDRLLLETMDALITGVMAGAGMGGEGEGGGEDTADAGVGRLPPALADVVAEEGALMEELLASGIKPKPSALTGAIHWLLRPEAEQEGAEPVPASPLPLTLAASPPGSPDPWGVPEASQSPDDPGTPPGGDHQVLPDGHLGGFSPRSSVSMRRPRKRLEGEGGGGSRGGGAPPPAWVWCPKAHVAATASTGAGAGGDCASHDGPANQRVCVRRAHVRVPPRGAGRLGAGIVEPAAL